MTIKTINRILHAAYNYDTIEALEDEMGACLSALIDEAWDAAEEAGNKDLAARCERAFNHLTGRDEG